MGEYEFVFGTHFVYHRWETDVCDGEVYAVETVSCGTVQDVLTSELLFEEQAEKELEEEIEELPF